VLRHNKECALMSQLGHFRPTHSTPIPAIVRYAPLATRMVRRANASDVPSTLGIPVSPLIDLRAHLQL
jgi:hypothetical protein